MKTALPDMTGVGDAAAKMPTDSSTVVLYFLLVLIAILVTKDIVGAWRHARTADKFASSAEKLSDVMKTDALQVTVQLALVQRELAEAKTERAKIMAALARVMK